MEDKFIDTVNEMIERKNITKAALSHATGIDKNSLCKYLLKQRSISLYAALQIAQYLSIDISKICGIPTELILSETETELIREIRKVPVSKRVPTIFSLTHIIQLIACSE